jgi:hypothetical protein
MSTSVAHPRTSGARSERKPRWLRFEENLQVRGLAMVEAFLTSADSPLFHPAPEETLERTVRRIRAALLLR